MSRGLFRNIKRGALFSLALVLAFSLSPSRVIAYSVQDFYSDNDILWYDKDFRAETCGGSFISGATNMHKMWNYLVGKGLSDEQAAGVLGNIEIESDKFSATRHEEGQPFSKGGWGIVQWTDERRDAIVSSLPADLLQYHDDKYGGATTRDTGFVAEGIPEEDNTKLLLHEMDYLYDEATSRPVIEGRGFEGPTEWDALMNSSSVREASDVWLFSFERPTDENQSEQLAQDRAELGQAIYDELVGTSGGGSGVGGDGVCIVGGNDELLSLVDKYTLPEWHDGPITGASNARPEYVADADKASKANLYMGAGDAPYYADCGGFVTLAIINSGFDPNYNYGAKYSQGAGPTGNQEAWVKENWQTIKSEGETDFDPAQLQVGDVAFTDGHTFLYIGDLRPDKTASASLRDRVPMAGTESKTASDVRWYRKG